MESPVPETDDYNIRRYLMVAHWQKQPVRPRISLVASGDARAQAHSYWKHPATFPKGSLGEQLQRLPPHILRHIGQYLCNGFEHLMLEQATGYSDIALLSPRHQVRIISRYRVGVNRTFMNDLAAHFNTRRIVELPLDAELRRKVHWKQIRIPNLDGVFVDALFLWCSSGKVWVGKVLGRLMTEWKKRAEPWLIMNSGSSEPWMVVLTMTRDETLNKPWKEARSDGKWAIQLFQFGKNSHFCRHRWNVKTVGGCKQLFWAETPLGYRWRLWDSPCVVHHVTRYLEVYVRDEGQVRNPMADVRHEPPSQRADWGGLVTRIWDDPHPFTYMPWEGTLMRIPFTNQWRHYFDEAWPMMPLGGLGGLHAFMNNPLGGEVGDEGELIDLVF